MPVVIVHAENLAHPLLGPIASRLPFFLSPSSLVFSPVSTHACFSSSGGLISRDGQRGKEDEGGKKRKRIELEETRREERKFDTSDIRAHIGWNACLIPISN